MCPEVNDRRPFAVSCYILSIRVKYYCRGAPDPARAPEAAGKIYRTALKLNPDSFVF